MLSAPSAVSVSVVVPPSRPETLDPYFDALAASPSTIASWSLRPTGFDVKWRGPRDPAIPDPEYDAAEDATLFRAVPREGSVGIRQLRLPIPARHAGELWIVWESRHGAEWRYEPADPKTHVVRTKTFQVGRWGHNMSNLDVPPKGENRWFEVPIQFAAGSAPVDPPFGRVEGRVYAVTGANVDRVHPLSPQASPFAIDDRWVRWWFKVELGEAPGEMDLVSLWATRAGDASASQLFDRREVWLGDGPTARGYVDWFWFEVQGSQSDRLTGPTMRVWGKNVIATTEAPDLVSP